MPNTETQVALEVIKEWDCGFLRNQFWFAVTVATPDGEFSAIGCCPAEAMANARRMMA